MNQSPPSPTSLKRGGKWLLLTVNSLVLVFFLYALHRAGGWRALLAPWQAVPAATLIAASSGQLLSYALRALRIYKAEHAIPRDRYFSCLRLIAINTAMNWLLPMRSGEASFPLLMKRWFGIDLGHGTGVLVWLRLLDLHVLATIGLLCLHFTLLPAGSAGGSLVTPILLILITGATSAPLVLFGLRRGLLSRLTASRLTASRLTAPRLTVSPLLAPTDTVPPSGVATRLRTLLHKMLSAVPARPIALFGDLILCWSAWAVKLASLGLLLAGLSGLPPARGVLGAIGGDISTVLPIHTPGGFGTYEAGVVAALTGAPVGLDQLLHDAVNLHLFALGIALLAGALALLPGTRNHAG